MRHDHGVYVGQMVDVAIKIEERAHRLDRRGFDVPDDLTIDFDLV